MTSGRSALACRVLVGLLLLMAPGSATVAADRGEGVEPWLPLVEGATYSYQGRFKDKTYSDQIRMRSHRLTDGTLIFFGPTPRKRSTSAQDASGSGAT